MPILLSVTDDPDPLRGDEDEVSDADAHFVPLDEEHAEGTALPAGNDLGDATPPEHNEVEPAPPVSIEPAIDAPKPDGGSDGIDDQPEPDGFPTPQEPIGTVALVPAAGHPASPPAPPEAVETAFRDDLPAPETPESEPRSPVQRFVVALLLIAAAALIGYVVSRPADNVSRNPDAIARSVEAARQLQFVLDTEDPLEARRFIRNEFGWRVGVPIFEDATLRGVAVADVAPAVEVPVFLYDDLEGREAAVFVYSYALLDQVPDRLALARDDVDALATEEPTVRRAGNAEVALWRDRDDIYVAITTIPPEALTEGLTMAR